jgi:hypothetical protein
LIEELIDTFNLRVLIIGPSIVNVVGGMGAISLPLMVRFREGKVHKE